MNEYINKINKNDKILFLSEILIYNKLSSFVIKIIITFGWAI